MKDKVIIIITFVGIGAGLAALVYVLFGNFANQNNNEPVTIEEPAEVIEEEPVIGDGTTIQYYGGPRDIKTFITDATEYALTRNPSVTNGLTLATANPFGSYYFALDENGNRIAYVAGDPQGLHGYFERGLVTGELVREKNSVTQYFIAYPDQTSARIMELPQVEDTGIANRYLASQFALVTNETTGKQVVAEIHHRSTQQDVLLVSEAVGRELDLDNGATANISIELIPQEGISTGPIRTADSDTTTN